VHAQILSSPKLICFPLSQNGKHEYSLELAHRFGIPDAAPVHLHHEFLELFFHSVVRSAWRGRVYVGEGHSPGPTAMAVFDEEVNGTKRKRAATLVTL
jgi:hypothetical protein